MSAFMGRWTWGHVHCALLVSMCLIVLSGGDPLPEEALEANNQLKSVNSGLEPMDFDAFALKATVPVKVPWLKCTAEVSGQQMTKKDKDWLLATATIKLSPTITFGPFSASASMAMNGVIFSSVHKNLADNVAEWVKFFVERDTDLQNRRATLVSDVRVAVSDHTEYMANNWRALMRPPSAAAVSHDILYQYANKLYQDATYEDFQKVADGLNEVVDGTPGRTVFESLLMGVSKGLFQTMYAKIQKALDKNKIQLAPIPPRFLEKKNLNGNKKPRAGIIRVFVGSATSTGKEDSGKRLTLTGVKDDFWDVYLSVKASASRQTAKTTVKSNEFSPDFMEELELWTPDVFAETLQVRLFDRELVGADKALSDIFTIEEITEEPKAYFVKFTHGGGSVDITVSFTPFTPVSLFQRFRGPDEDGVFTLQHGKFDALRLKYRRGPRAQVSFWTYRQTGIGGAGVRDWDRITTNMKVDSKWNAKVQSVIGFLRDARVPMVTKDDMANFQLNFLVDPTESNQFKLTEALFQEVLNRFTFVRTLVRLSFEKPELFTPLMQGILIRSTLDGLRKSINKVFGAAEIDSGVKQRVESVTESALQHLEETSNHLYKEEPQKFQHALDTAGKPNILFDGNIEFGVSATASNKEQTISGGLSLSVAKGIRQRLIPAELRVTPLRPYTRYQVKPSFKIHSTEVSLAVNIYTFDNEDMRWYVFALSCKTSKAVDAETMKPLFKALQKLQLPPTGDVKVAIASLWKSAKASVSNLLPASWKEWEGTTSTSVNFGVNVNVWIEVKGGQKTLVPGFNNIRPYATSTLGVKLETPARVWPGASAEASWESGPMYNYNT